MIKNIKKGVPATIIFEQANIPVQKDIRLAIVGERGNVIKDSAGLPLENIKLDEVSNKYQTTATISDQEPDQFIRLYFSSNDIVVQDIYYPQDAKLISGLQAKAEVVPVQYFIDYVLNGQFHADPIYKKAVTDYAFNNRDAVKRELLSAEGKLELKSKLYFSERTISQEKEDFFFDRFSIHLWQFIVNYPPINNLEKFEIQFGSRPVAEVATSLFIWDRETGIIEFLPAPSGDSAGLYSLLMQNLSGLTLSIFLNSNLERIPALFRATYKTGLIYTGGDEAEKEAIRGAICNRALMNLAPKIDPAMRSGSFSEGIDGVSAQRSYNVKEVLRELKEQEDEFVKDLRQKYGRNLDMVVV